MRRLLAAWYRQLAARLDATAGDARFLGGGSAGAPGTYENDMAWMVVGPSLWENFPGLYVDGRGYPRKSRPTPMMGMSPPTK